MNLNEKNSEPSSLIWNIQLMIEEKEKYRIDIELENGISLVGERKIKFYKINFIVKKSILPGVVVENELLFEFEKKNQDTDFLIMCETNFGVIRIINDSKHLFDFKYEFLKVDSLKNNSNRKIHQVDPSLFPEVSKSCKGHYKKIFVIEKKKNDKEILTITTRDTSIDSLFLESIDREGGTYPDFVTVCKKRVAVSNIFNILNRGPLKGDVKTNLYPEKAILVLNKKSFTELSDICLEKEKGIALSSTYIKVNYELQDFSKIYKKDFIFYYNFNAISKESFKDLPEDKKSKVKNFVYLSDEIVKYPIDLNFKIFEFPKLDINNLFFSFIKCRFKKLP